MRHLMNLVGRAIRLWRRHEDDPIKSGSEALNSSDTAPQVSHHNTVHDGLGSRLHSEDSASFQSNLPDAIQQPKEGGIFKINEGSIGACYRGNAALNAGDNLYDGGLWGRLDHDLNPLLWDKTEQCWVSLKESSD
jgi:hypothetical protein